MTVKKISLKRKLSTLQLLYILIMAVMIVSGLGQMPIFKRYYVASLPGLAWTGNYMITHYLHYAGAAALAALASYSAVSYLTRTRRHLVISKAGAARLAVLAGLFVSGLVKVIVAVTDTGLSREALFFTNIIHVSFTLLLIFGGLALIVTGKQWLTVTAKNRK